MGRFLADVKVVDEITGKENGREEQTAVIIQAMCCRQKPRRMSHQPNEMKTVLVALSDAFTAGRSEIVMANQESKPKWSASL